jgi:hypothetical protein
MEAGRVEVGLKREPAFVAGRLGAAAIGYDSADCGEKAIAKEHSPNSASSSSRATSKRFQLLHLGAV